MALRQIDAFTNEKLDSIKANNLYRTLKTVTVKGPFVRVNGKKAIHLCSNDYLGLSQDRRVAQAASKSLRYVSQASSRLIAGNSPSLEKLEVILARHRLTEAALIFPTGYMANLGVLTALADERTTIYSDELNHASIIDACRLSGANVQVFRHNDIDHLENILHRTGRKIVITEGIFSMDGDAADLRSICDVAQKHNAITIVDDAHGDFIVGPSFSGMPANQGADVDIHVSSLSKGLGCFGGYVAASNKIRELLVNTSRQFIYTSALPDHLCAAAIEAVPLAKDGNLQKRLQSNIKFLTIHLQNLGFTLGNSASQIIPVILGSEKNAVTFSQELLKNGIFAQAVRYPTVRKGSARLRVSLTAMHTRSHLKKAVDVFSAAGKKTGVI